MLGLIKNKIKTVLKDSDILLKKYDYLPYGMLLEADLKRYISKKEFVIIDAGANVGQSAVEFNRWFPCAEIHCFEPIQQTFDYLLQNVQHLSKIHAQHLGLGSSEQTLEITLDDNALCNSLNNTVMVHNKKEKSEIITTTYLDKYCENQNINEIEFLKIDTEGYEIEVLKGSHKLLKEKRIKFIAAEISFLGEKDNLHSSFNDVFEHLKTYDYSFMGIYEQTYYQSPSKLEFAMALFGHFQN